VNGGRREFSLFCIGLDKILPFKEILEVTFKLKMVTFFEFFLLNGVNWSFKVYFRNFFRDFGYFLDFLNTLDGLIGLNLFFKLLLIICLNLNYVLCDTFY
jgi:hypothetical protein